MQTFLYPKFQAIKSFSTDKILSSRLEQVQIFDDLKNAGNKITEDYKHNALVQNYETRSLKVMCDPLDISFEQNFMEEHKISFKKESEKYIEAQQKLLEIFSKQNQIKKVFNQETNINGEVEVEKILKNSPQNLLTEEQSERLIIDLRREDKLQEFIQAVMPKLDQEVKIELIYAAKELWEEYILIQEQNYSFQETVEFGQNFTKKSIQKLDQRLNYLNFKFFYAESENIFELGIRGERFKHFNNFVVYLYTTFSLIIAGFFQNPYFKDQSNYLKRGHKEGVFNFGSLNDDQDKDYQDEQDNDENEDYYKKKRVKY